MVIPFKTLRFTLRFKASGPQVWGIDVPPQRNLEVKPYAISSATTNNVAWPAVSNKVDG